jgi:hypothetical protein
MVEQIIVEMYKLGNLNKELYKGFGNKNWNILFLLVVIMMEVMIS